MRKAFYLVPLILLLLGCAAVEEAPVQTEATIPVTQVPETQITQTEPPPVMSIVLVPEASGILVDCCDAAQIDYSHKEDGYVMVQYFAQTDARLKVLVKGPTTTYQYNLPQGEWTVLPLSDGSGSYQVGVYRNTHGSKYAAVMSTTFDVELTDEFAPFLRPNQYVNYVNAPVTMDTAAQLCVGMEHPLEKVAAVYNYVTGNLTYDEEKAENVKSGYLPVLDEVLQQKKGICFDYAAMMTAMLRSQNVPCKLVVGYAGTVYHAWISVWTEESGWLDGVIFFDGKVWKRMDPTFASSAEGNEEILDFIENGTYTVKYIY
ncbi:MAG: transglutaminase domain-containing protein [Oscillospiraceae bacterium]|nr:transglutaminase domain-containing protein [Oscillospiraceae bacterium]